ncbi:MAG: hypothetical protein MN733_09765 [Nitrososphaera sp.]|nr:hypothetical protein [Nitrososphaera sp.]
MSRNTKILLLAAVLSTTLAGVFMGVQFASAGAEGSKKADSDGPTIEQAKLIIEHNAADEDTGFQGFVDGTGWNRMMLTGPDGRQLDFKAKGELGQLGLTELFFETVEPENAEVPISEIWETLPEGTYTYEATGIEVGEKLGKTSATATLTHDIPAAPELLTPEEDEEVPVDDLLVSWEPVDKTINGRDINIIAYQLIIEKDEEPHPNMIGTFGLSMYLPPDVTEITIPGEFFEPGTEYEWELLAIEESGNQTINSSSFSTED